MLMNLGAEQAAQFPGRVLIVEDEPLIGLHLKDCFERAGIDTVWVQSDRAAYVALNGRGRPFDAAILDVDLGRGTTGFDVARHARSLTPEIGIVICSGSPPDWVHSFGVPDAIVLPKPCTEAGLLEAALRSVEKRRQQPANESLQIIGTAAA
jgi:DNA-binding response OmpR family regulator